MQPASVQSSTLSRRGTAFFYLAFSLIILYILVRAMVSPELRHFDSSLEPLGWVAFATAGLVLLYLSARLLTRRIHRVLPTLLIVGVVTALPRLAWILIAPTKPASDFSLYYSYAVHVANGNLGQYHQTFPIFPFKAGFGLFLGTYMHIFGTSETSVKIFNMAISISTALLIWWIADMLGGRFAANFSALAYAGYISQIMFTSVIASEHLATALMLAGFGVLIRAYQLYELAGPDGTPLRSRLLLLSAGFLIGISALVRPTGMLLIPILLLFVVFGLGEWRFGRRALIDKVACFGLPLVGLGLSVLIVSLPLSKAVGVPLHQSSAWFSIMMGTNEASGGGYARTDAAIMKELHYNVEEVRETSKAISVQHIDEMGWGFFKFAEAKTVDMWARDNYGSEWSVQEAGQLRADGSKSEMLALVEFHEQTYYVMLLMTFLVSGLRLSRSRAKLPLIPVLFFLGSFAAYILMEVQSRYHYPMIVFLITIAGLSATQISRDDDEPISGQALNIPDGNETVLDDHALGKEPVAVRGVS